MEYVFLDFKTSDFIQVLSDIAKIRELSIKRRDRSCLGSKYSAGKGLETSRPVASQIPILNGLQLLFAQLIFRDVSSKMFKSIR